MMIKMPVALLAGGLATRLYPKTKKIPKALIEICGEPFIARQMRNFKREGIKRVVICAGYLGEMIKAFVKDGSAFGLEVDYSFDGDKLLGTGGSLKKALPLLGDCFYVVYGDSYLDVKYEDLGKAFVKSEKELMICVYKNSGRFDKSNIFFKDGRIKLYDKKNASKDMQYIDYGAACIKSEILAAERECAFDLSDIYSKYSSLGRAAAYEVFNRFYEIGSFEGIKETEEYFQRIESGNEKL